MSYFKQNLCAKNVAKTHILIFISECPASTKVCSVCNNIGIPNNNYAPLETSISLKKLYITGGSDQNV